MAAGNATSALAAAMGAPQLSYQLNIADVQPLPTPWGPVAAVLLCLLPILFLLATTLLPPLLLPSGTSLPLSAALLAAIRLAYLASPPLLVLSHSMVGALEGLVPLAVIFGAVLLFEAMAATGCLQFLMANVRCLSAGSPIAEVFLIGWAFAYTISGVGGFSTPMALATPMLVSLGHDPLSSLVAVVGLNGLAAHLGSVGMAVWFGFKSLNLSHSAILAIGLKSAVVVGACSFVLAPAAAAALVPWRDLLCNAGFILLSVGSAVVPTVLLAMVSPEFPLVAGGLISMAVTWLLVRYSIGLKPPCTHTAPDDIETATTPPAPCKAAEDEPAKVLADGSATAAGVRARAAAAVATVELLAAGKSLHPSTAAAHQDSDLSHSTATGSVAVAPSSSSSSSSSNNSSSSSSSNSSPDKTSSSPKTPAAPAGGHLTVPLPSGDQPGRPSSSSSSSSGGDRGVSSRRGARLVSPFEVYCKLPLPGEESFKPATEPGNASNRCPTQSDMIIARRSRSLVAAAAAVGGLVVQKHPATPRSAAEGPVCVFRCPSCVPDQADLAAAEAEATSALTRQLSAPDAAMRAAAAAAAAAAQRRAQDPRHHQPQQQQQHESVLLPALSVVNHATGDHIIISGMDKLTGFLRLLLHPRRSIFAHMPFAFGPPSRSGSGSGSRQDLSALPAWQHHGGGGGVGAPVGLLEVVGRTMPIWLTVLLLLVTHTPALKLQDMLRSTSPSFTLHLGTLGALSLSPALVLQLRQVFTHPTADWTAELLYMPCVIPFVVVSGVTLLLFKRDLREAGVAWKEPFANAWRKVKGTVSAMVGALVLAQLMSAGGKGSPAFIIAYYLTTWMGKGYLAIAGFLGALGSFVSGSVMGSNMTQGGIQAVAAARLGVPVTSLLAVQVAGACAGKMVCISSILSAKVVLSELHDVSESQVIRRTGPLALLFVVLAQLLGLIWTLGGVWPD